MDRKLPLFPMVMFGAACLMGSPAAGQEAQACADQVGQLAAAFAIDRSEGGKVQAAIEQEPGSRKGASLDEEQRHRLGTLVEEARQAGERGDGQGCLQRLAEVRTVLREAGVGGGQPGTADSPGTRAVGGGTTGTAGTTTPPAGSAGGSDGSSGPAGGVTGSGTSGSGSAGGSSGGGSSGGS